MQNKMVSKSKRKDNRSEDRNIQNHPWCSIHITGVLNPIIDSPSTLIVIIIVILNISTVYAARKSSQDNQRSYSKENKNAIFNPKVVEDENEDETPFEKDPHFLVWKILTKLLILTVLRATKRFWSPNFSTLVHCYGIYMLITLGMWLHICFNVFMENIYSTNSM